MELNEYAVWRVRLKVMERQYVQGEFGSGEMNYAGDAKVFKELTIVAPKGPLGRALLDVHFDNAFRHRQALESGKSWEYFDEPKEETLDNVIRYEDAYRGRM
jgi:hypothetical protein